MAAVLALVPHYWMAAPASPDVARVAAESGPVLFTRPDCRPCRAAERALARRSLGREVEVVDVSGRERGWSPRVLPTLVSVAADGRPRVHEGASVITRSPDLSGSTRDLRRD